MTTRQKDIVLEGAGKVGSIGVETFLEVPREKGEYLELEIGGKDIVEILENTGHCPREGTRLDP